MKQSIFILFVFSMAFQSHAQQQNDPSPNLFIYDASGSMWGELDGKTKKEIASDVLSTAVNKLPDNQNIGLIAYGHREKGDCKDVEFLVDLQNNSKDKVNAAKTEGIDFKFNIVLFGLKEGEAEQLKCAANAGDGKYYDAADAAGLGDVLTEATPKQLMMHPGILPYIR